MPGMSLKALFTKKLAEVSSDRPPPFPSAAYDELTWPCAAPSVCRGPLPLWSGFN